jgi:hypothetical protein
MSGERPLLHAATAFRTMCGVAALFGLFAMHGLATHRTAHQGHSSELTVMTSVEHAGTSMNMHDQAEEAPTSSTPEDQTPNPALLGLVGLCLAVLMIGVVLRLAVRRGIPAYGDRGRALPADGLPSHARRERDPPSRLALSIQRC